MEMSTLHLISTAVFVLISVVLTVLVFMYPEKEKNPDAYGARKFYAGICWAMALVLLITYISQNVQF